jgi:hypothetical protein
MKTLADFPSLALSLAAHDAPPEPDCILFVVAPCCGRVTAADTIFDVRHVAGTIVSGGGVTPPKDHDWLCDGCRQRLEANAATNGWTASRFLAACGAAAITVRGHYLGEIATLVEQMDHAAGVPHSIEETRAILDAQLPAVIP